VHGDTHAGYEPAFLIHTNFVGKFFDYDPDIIFNTGDVVHKGSNETHWEIFDNITEELRDAYPYFPTIGNHDDDDPEGLENYLEFFSYLPGNKIYYYVEHPLAIFVVLDVDSAIRPGNLDAQKTWLENVLTNHSDKLYKFVFFHRTSYTSGSRGACFYAREFDPIFQTYDVDIVFMGHIHAYERFYINGIHYVVTGGSGGVPHSLNVHNDYPLGSRMAFAESYNYMTVQANKKIAFIETKDSDDNIIDSFYIFKTMQPMQPMKLIKWY
jgi:predicted phosphodiesterase